jgi:hypothetical protein
MTLNPIFSDQRQQSGEDRAPKGRCRLTRGEEAASPYRGNFCCVAA